MWPISQAFPTEAETPSWVGVGLQQGDLTQASSTSGFLGLLTQLLPTVVPWQGTRSLIQCPPDTQLGKQSIFHSNLPLSQRPCTRHNLHHALHLAALSGRSGNEGGDRWMSLMMPRYQHGLLTKLALSSVIHSYPLRLVCSAACERGPVQKTEQSGSTPLLGT